MSQHPNRSRLGEDSLRRVVKSTRIPGTPLATDVLECGHICTVQDDGRERRKCPACGLLTVGWPTGK